MTGALVACNCDAQEMKFSRFFGLKLMLQALIVEPLSLLVNKCQNQNIIGGFCTDSISSSGYIDLEKETGKN